MKVLGLHGTGLVPGFVSVAILAAVTTAVLIAAVVTAIVLWVGRQRPPGSLYDESSSRTLDHALKSLAANCALVGEPKVTIIMIETDAASIRLRLSAPRSSPPLPWVSSAGDTIWSCATDRLAEFTVREVDGQSLSTTGAAPGLVAIRVDGQSRTLVDLHQARGLIALDGDIAQTLEVARRWIEQYSQTPWSQDSSIVLVGLAAIAMPNTGTSGSLDDVLTAVASGEVGVCFLREFPAGEPGIALRRAIESVTSRCAVVALGEASLSLPTTSKSAHGCAVTLARWRFSAAPDGQVTSLVFPGLATGFEHVRVAALAAEAAR